MLPRFHWTDISTVGHYLGVLIILTGALMLVPAAVALLFGEMRSCVGFVFGAGLSFLVGSLLRLLRASALDRRRSLLLTGLSWLVIAAFAAVPFYLTGDFDSTADALFDAVSALTTTGATLAGDLDHLGYAHIVWRALLTLVGGMAVVFIALYLGFTGEGGAQVLNKRHTSVGDRSSALSLSWKFVGGCGLFYVAVGTLVAYLIGLSLGLSPVDSAFEGFSLAANALNTSGFVPHSSNVIYYHSLVLEGFLSVYLIIGSINFGIFGCAMRGNGKTIRRNSELRAFAIWLLVLVVLVTVALTRDNVLITLGGLFSNGVFMAVSTATTGGFQTVYPEQVGGVLSDSMLIILSVAALFGTCSQSTGGGIKIIRVLQVLRWIGYSILRKLMPDSARIRIRYEHFGLKTFESHDAMRAMTVFILYLVGAAIGAMAFIAHGNDALQSVFEAVCYVSNTGATAGLTSPDMSIDLKVCAMLLMWLGRLEFIALLAVLVGLALSLSPRNLFGQRLRDRDLSRKKRGNKGGTAWRRRKQQGEKSRRGSRAQVGASLIALALVASFAWAPAARAAQGSGQDGGAAVGTGGAVTAQEVSDLADTSYYRKMSIGGMLAATVRLEGQGVSFKGEAVGAPIVADAEHKWVNVVSNGAMIGVYLANEQADKISHWGGHDTTGDTIRVKGIFHLACADHDGELEVHGATLKVTAQGAAVEEGGWSRELLFAGAVMAALGLLVSIAQRLVFGKRQSHRPRFV